MMLYPVYKHKETHLCVQYTHINAVAFGQANDGYLAASFSKRTSLKLHHLCA